MTTKVAMDMGLFRSLSAHGTARVELKASDLASSCNSDIEMTARVLRVLVSNGIISQTRPDTFASTEFSHTLATENATGTVSYMNDVCMPCFGQIPAYFSRHGYKNPVRPQDAPWMPCMKTESSFFDWLHDHPKQLADFGALQIGTQSLVPFWADVYPADQLMQKFQVSAGDTHNALLVDIGGGGGSDLNHFLEKYPSHPGTLILQDLAQVLDTAMVDSSIVKMPYDFFTSQPVIGALIYYFHNCLHNWTDEQALQILQNLRPALRKGYSKVILHENIILDEHPTQWCTTIDMTMMTLLGASERTEYAWRRLCGCAGFDILNIWPARNSATCLIELERN